METPASVFQSDRPASPKRSPTTPLVLSLLVFGALALRLWGITWSLPNQEHLFSYHPDEGVNLVKGVLDRDGAPRPHLDLRFYNYGSLYFYIWQGASAINRAYGFVALPATGAPEKREPESFATLILVGRLVNAVFGALTILPVYFLGRRLFGPLAGWFAAAVYAVIPVAVIHAHFATVDTIATLFVASALAAGARLVSDATVKNALLAGILCGLAAAAKYNCGLVILAPAVAVAMYAGVSKKRRALLLGLLLAVSLLGFLIGCPGILLNWSGFWKDFGYELHKSGEGMGLLFVNTGNGWLYHLKSSLRYGVGIPLLLLALCGLAVALYRRTREDWYLLAFLIPYYLVIGYAQVRFTRYIMPMLPALAVILGRFVAGSLANRRAAGKLVSMASFAALVVTFLISLSLDHVMAIPDPRDRAKAFLDSNAKPGSSIAFARLPWYDVPPLAPEFTAPSPRSRTEAAQSLTRYLCRIPGGGAELDPAVLGPPEPTYAITSDIATEDWERLQIPEWLEMKRLLQARYSRVDFQNTPSVFGIGFGKPDYVPNDLLYIYPRISIYMRK